MYKVFRIPRRPSCTFCKQQDQNVQMHQKHASSFPRQSAHSAPLTWQLNTSAHTHTYIENTNTSLSECLASPRLWMSFEMSRRCRNFYRVHPTHLTETQPAHCVCTIANVRSTLTAGLRELIVVVVVVVVLCITALFMPVCRVKCMS